MHFPLLKGVAKRVVFRKVVAFATLVALATSTSPIVSAASLFERPVLSPGELASIAHEQRLSSDVAACASVDTRSVQRSINQLVAMRRLNATRPVETPESRNMWRDHAAYVRSILKTMPRNLPLTSYHAMTPVEYATFRAAETAVRDGLSASIAVKACPGQALAALRSLGPHPLWQTCASCPGGIPPVMKVATNSLNTNYSEMLSTNGVPYSARGYTSAGSQIMAASYGSVTISGLPGTSGSVPGVEVSLNLSGVSSYNISYALPEPAYVPQTGWTTLAGQTWQGKAIPAYLNPTASQPNDFVQLDSTDSYQTTETSAGYYETSFTTSAQRSSLNCVFTQSSTELGSQLMNLGGSIAAIGSLASRAGFSIVGAPLQVFGDALSLVGAAITWIFGGTSAGGGCGISRGADYHFAGALSMVPNRPIPQCQASNDDDY